MALKRRTTATPDRRSVPAYPVAEAARYLRVPVGTIRDWVEGSPRSAGREARRPALVRPAGRNPIVLSFWNLVECHVLRALRTVHDVPMSAVRQAIEYAEKREKIDNLLRHKELRAGAGRLFLERVGQLVDLSNSGQLAMREVFEKHLDRVRWDRHQFPIRLHPFVSADGSSAEMPIAIDPLLAFGRPFLVDRGVTTAVIAERLDAGETERSLAKDYGLSPGLIRQAILYERVA